MVQGGVQQDAILVEAGALDAGVLVQGAHALQLPVRDHDGCITAIWFQLWSHEQCTKPEDGVALAKEILLITIQLFGHSWSTRG